MTDAGFDPALVPVADPYPYFSQVQDHFYAALRACPDEFVQRDFVLADQRVRFRVVGRKLAYYLTHAFEHIRATESGDDVLLTVDAWDEQVTGIGRPAPPPLEMVYHFSGDHQVVYRTLGLEQVNQTSEAKIDHWVNWKDGRVVGWYASAEDCPIAERSRPLMSVLPRSFIRSNVLMVHAGLVETGGRGALIVGPSGVGKTTTSLACLVAGLGLLSDDHCAVQVGPSSTTGYSLFSTSRLFPQDLDRFPPLKAVAITNTGDDKAMVLLHPTFSAQLPLSTTIRVLLMPRQTARAETSFSPAPPLQAALALMPSISLVLKHDTVGWAFEQVTEMARRVPCYWLEAGTDISKIPAAIAALLRSLDDELSSGS